jgi:hypothetical protein
MITAPLNPACRDDDSPEERHLPVVWSPLSCSARRLASTILPSPVQSRVLVRPAPMGHACDRGRAALFGGDRRCVTTALTLFSAPALASRFADYAGGDICFNLAIRLGLAPADATKLSHIPSDTHPARCS